MAAAASSTLHGTDVVASAKTRSMSRGQGGEGGGCAAVMHCFDVDKIFVKIKDDGSGVVAFRL
jgi:hypothetical protein